MATLSATEVLEAYAKGIFSDHEVVSRFIEAAASVPPSQLIPVLPAKLLEPLKERAETPPESPDDVIIVSGHVPMRYESEVEAKAAAARLDANQRAFRQAYFDGALAWQRYFSRF